MATIKICPLVVPTGGGPSLPVFHARIVKRPLDGRSEPQLEVMLLTLGHDTVEIWPVPEELRALAH